MDLISKEIIRLGEWPCSLVHSAFQVFFGQVSTLAIVVLVLLQALQVGSHELLAFAYMYDSIGGQRGNTRHGELE